MSPHAPRPMQAGYYQCLLSVGCTSSSLNRIHSFTRCYRGGTMDGRSKTVVNVRIPTHADFTALSWPSEPGNLECRCGATCPGRWAACGNATEPSHLSPYHPRPSSKHRLPRRRGRHATRLRSSSQLLPQAVDASCASYMKQMWLPQPLAAQRRDGSTGDLPCWWHAAHAAAHAQCTRDGHPVALKV